MATTTTTSKRFELSAWPGDAALTSFKCAVTLKSRWLSKGPGELIGLFLEHYAKKKFGRPAKRWTAGDFEVCTAAGVAISDCAELRSVPASVLVRSLAPEATLTSCCDAVKSVVDRPTTGVLFHLLEGRIGLQDLPHPGLYSRLLELFRNEPEEPRGDDAVEIEVALEISGYQSWRKVTGEQRRALETALVPRRADLGALLGGPLKFRTRFDRRRSAASPLLCYVSRNVFDAKGVLWTYEALVAIADYLSQRLAVKPIGYRSCVVQVSKFASLAARLSRMDAKLDVRVADDLETAIRHDRPTILLVDAWTDNLDVLQRCKNAVKDEDGSSSLDVPEMLLFAPADLALQLEGYRTHRLDDLAAHLLHAYDDPHDHLGTTQCLAYRSAGKILCAFRDPDEVAFSKAQGTVARVLAQAQRGAPPDPDDLRNLQQANDLIAATPDHIRRGVVARRDDDDDDEDL